jgi:cysteine desulfurase / selenocysteine lyase
MGTNFRTHIAGLDTTVPVKASRQAYSNLDNAASTPPFKSVLRAVDDFAPWYSSVHRGNGFKSQLSTAVYGEAREIVGRFVGADPNEHVVIFGKNTTEAINKLSYRLTLHKKDIVLISHLEHHSNDLPWRARATVKRIGITADGAIDREDFIKLLTRHRGQVRLVAISGASNVTGHMPDIHWFARQAHAAGAQIVVDCAQLAAHRPIIMGRLCEPGHLDYVAISGHKMYAPFGTGALIGRRDTFMRGEPEYRGGGTVSIVTDRTVDWATPPECDEAGSPNVVGAVALARAMRTLEHIGLPAIARHETKLTKYALRRLQQVKGVRIYGSTDPAEVTGRSGVIPFTVGNMPAHLIAAILGAEWGIGVRSGCFCAQPYVMSLLGIDRMGSHHIRYVALHRRRDLLPGMVRISFGLYNTMEEIDGLIMALQAICRGQHGRYTVDKDTGFYTPVEATGDFAPYFKI